MTQRFFCFCVSGHSEAKQPRRAASIGAKHVFVLSSDQDESETQQLEPRRVHEEHAKGIEHATWGTMTHASVHIGNVDYRSRPSVMSKCVLKSSKSEVRG
ncbi:hypothetical protein HN011_001944 [Eciton burchellii]|nr:hypothetical protein HN011_001944 [Eciton burchellii]